MVEYAFNVGDQGLILGQKDLLEKRMATHSSILGASEVAQQ